MHNYPEEFLGVFDEEGHSIVEFLQVVLQVSSCHLEGARVKHSG